MPKPDRKRRVLPEGRTGLASLPEGRTGLASLPEGLTGLASLPEGLTGLAGLACAACCVLPLLLAAGVLGGAGWAMLGQLMPGIAVVLAAFAGLAWWWSTRRRAHAAGCGGGDCACG